MYITFEMFDAALKYIFLIYSSCNNLIQISILLMRGVNFATSLSLWMCAKWQSKIWVVNRQMISSHFHQVGLKLFCSFILQNIHEEWFTTLTCKTNNKTVAIFEFAKLL